MPNKHLNGQPVTRVALCKSVGKICSYVAVGNWRAAYEWKDTLMHQLEKMLPEQARLQD